MRWIVAALLALFTAGPCLAGSPALVVAFYAKPQNRAPLHQLLQNSEAEKLASWKGQGLLSGYDLLFARYPDRNEWDAMEVLRFPDDAAMTRWRLLTGGIADPKLLSVAESIETSPADLERREGAGSSSSVMLVLPYQTFVTPQQYESYLDGYTVPQFRGWMKAGVLDGFDILSSRYPAGRPWNDLILLRYHDDPALARRDEVVSSTRRALSSDPRWKAWSDSKKKIRSEGALVVADEVTGGGGGR